MRSLSRIFIAYVTLALLVVAVGVSNAQAQETIPVADAAAFMGSWTIAVDAQGTPFQMGLNVTNESGNVAAEVSSDMGTTKVSRITKNADKLVLSFSMDAQGQAVPVIITLTPTAEGVNADLDFAAGMFTATGKGTKKAS